MGKGKLTAYDNLLAQLDSIRKHNNDMTLMNGTVRSLQMFPQSISTAMLNI